jgi:transposase-like protein
MKKSRTKPRTDQASQPAHITIQMPLPMATTFDAMKDEFFELCLEAGQRVLSAMMEADRTQRCGPKWVARAARTVRRAGSTPSAVTLGGRRIVVKRLRARTVSGTEVTLPSFTGVAKRDPLDRRTMEAVAVGVATRRYRRSLDPLPASITERAASKSAVSRRFVARSMALLAQWLARPLEGLELATVMIDGIFFDQRCVLIALGIEANGQKHVLGLHEGSTENATVAKTLLSDLIERGLDPERPLLFVIDGGKGLRRAIAELWGTRALVQRCQVHKRRNVRAHLPERLHGRVSAAMQRAYDTANADHARTQLERLAREFEREHPGAAASLREGLEETLTLQRLGVTGMLYRALRSTNAIENLNGSIAAYSHNVKRWRDGRMVLRWVGAALHEAASHFNRMRGYRELPTLIAALTKLDKESKNAA